MTGEYQALALGLHRVGCDRGRVTPAAEHPFHYTDAKAIIEELKRWDVHVIHISPVDEFAGLTVDAEGRIAA